MLRKHTSWWWLLLFLLPIAAFMVWVFMAFSGGDSTYNARREVKIALAELKKDPQNLSAAIRAGVGYYNLGLYDKAIEYYQLATSIDADSADALNNLGNTYRELLRYDDAESVYKKALALKPDMASIYLNLSELYLRWPVEKRDRSQEAPKILKQGLQATDNDPEILRSLVDYYKSTGDTQSASQYEKQLQDAVSAAGSR